MKLTESERPELEAMAAGAPSLARVTIGGPLTENDLKPWEENQPWQEKMWRVPRSEPTYVRVDTVPRLYTTLRGW